MSDIDVLSLVGTVPAPQRPILLKKLLKTLPCSSSSLQSLLSSFIPILSSNRSTSLSTLLTTLQSLLTLLQHSPSLSSTNCSSLLPHLQQLLSHPRDGSGQVTALTLSCISRLVEHSETSSETGRQVSGATPGLVTVVLAVEGQALTPSVNLLVTLMSRYSGSCGQSKARIQTYLVNQFGRGLLPSSVLGKAFSLLPQLGGGGKEGAEHSNNYSALLGSLIDTTHKSLSSLFQNVREFENYSSERTLLVLPAISGSLGEKSLGLTRQLVDLMAVTGSLLTRGFPAMRTIPVDQLLSLPTRLLSLASGKGMAAGEQQLQLSSYLLPHLVRASLELTAHLVVATGPDLLLPEAATINSLVLAGLVKQDNQTTSAPLVRTGLYSLLSAWLEQAGAASGLDLVLDKLIPAMMRDIRPVRQKMVLTNGTWTAGGKKRNKNKKGGGGNKSASLETQASELDPDVCAAALSALEHVLTTLGPWLAPALHTSVSSTLLSQALAPGIPNPASQQMLSCLTALSSSPGQHNPGQLVLPALSLATASLGAQATRALGGWESTLHPQRLSLDIQDTSILSRSKLEESLKNQDLETVGEDRETEQSDSFTQTEETVANNDVANFNNRIKMLEEALKKAKKEKYAARTDNEIEESIVFKERKMETIVLKDVKNRHKSGEKISVPTEEISTSAGVKRSVETSSGDIFKKPRVSFLSSTEILIESEIVESGESVKSKEDQPSDGNDEPARDVEQLSVDQMLSDFSSRLSENLSVGLAQNPVQDSDDE